MTKLVATRFALAGVGLTLVAAGLILFDLRIALIVIGAILLALAIWS